MSNLRFNGTSGQFSTILSSHHFFETPRLAFNFVDSFNQLADFVVVSKLTAEENDCSKDFELLMSIPNVGVYLTYFARRFLEYCSANIQSRKWIGLDRFGWKV